jgi:enediyne biosynthesis protein E4
MRDFVFGLLSRLTPRRLLVLPLVVAALLVGAVKAAQAWWCRAGLARARRDMALGQYSPALARLQSLSARWPRRAEVEYRLRVREAALGHVDAALTAWERVPRDSPGYPRATLNRARLALDHGRLAIALASLVPILVDNGQVGAQASQLADQVDLFMGRRRAISRRIEQWWAVSSDQAALLRLHWQLDSQPSSTLAMSEALDRMALHAPEDDGVWLGRAELATASGRYDETDAFLDADNDGRLSHRPGSAWSK